MAQKKKAPVSPKSAAKPALRKAVPLKVAASAQKSAKQTVKSKIEVAQKPPLAKAKVAQPVAAVKSVKKSQPERGEGRAQGRACHSSQRSRSFRRISP